MNDDPAPQPATPPPGEVGRIPLPRRRPRSAVRITAEHVGSRVSMQFHLAGDDSGATKSEAIGLLRSWDDGVLVVERRDGSLAEVPEALLIAARAVPAAPPRRRPAGEPGSGA